VTGTPAPPPSTGDNQAVETNEGERLLDAIARRLAVAGVIANAAGGIDLFVFGALLLPVHPEHVDRTRTILLNTGLFVPLLATTLLLGHRWGRSRTIRVRPWLREGRAPTPAERDEALRLPLVQARITATFWAAAAVVFTVFNLIIAPGIAAAVPVIMLLGGITTSTVYYLMAERILRPVTARALAAGLPDRPVGPGVGGRVTIVWLGASGVPLIGIAATALTGLLSHNLSRGLLAGSVLFLAVLALAVGLYATAISARSLADPLASVRRALERVERGDFDAEVPVDSGSDLGLVEAGVNRMTAGLRERERLRDLFGRHVGRDVAMAALDGGGVELGGETRFVGVLFADMIGSTGLAATLPPKRVVALLNGFFAIVVEVTESHGGIVNKFEGDGALCVFGAPVDLPDPAGAALAAARELRARLLDELPQVDAAIAVSAGEAVAGNVGAEQRYEYTVIGDPVNEAARLSELAKRMPERLIASDAAVQRAAPEEAARWALGEATVLRGREEPTRVATVGAPT
jgi:adenylate cyclase